MFQPDNLKIVSVIAMLLSLIGLILSVVSMDKENLLFLGIISWGILLWASYLGFRLSSYKLYEDEYRKVGIRIYLIILAFILFLGFGYIVGFLVSVILLSTLWGLKKNYDHWEPSEVSQNVNDTEDKDTP